MISWFNTLEALLYCLVFMAAILLSDTVIAHEKIDRLDRTPRKSRIKIAIMMTTVALMTLSVYSTHCRG